MPGMNPTSCQIMRRSRVPGKLGGVEGEWEVPPRTAGQWLMLALWSQQHLYKG